VDDIEKYWNYIQNKKYPCSLEIYCYFNNIKHYYIELDKNSKDNCVMDLTYKMKHEDDIDGFIYFKRINELKNILVKCIK
jgi:hypothetical protein